MEKDNSNGKNNSQKQKGVMKKLDQSKKIKRDKSGRHLIKVDKEVVKERS